MKKWKGGVVFEKFKRVSPKQCASVGKTTGSLWYSKHRPSTSEILRTWIKLSWDGKERVSSGLGSGVSTD
eukprot:1673488-Amphidinium_carterae.1